MVIYLCLQSTRGSGESDTLLNSRYLRPQSPADNTNQPSFSIDDVLAGSRNGPLDHDFDPGNRLEASGFNADDASALVKLWSHYGCCLLIC
jgi:hypothetical protein